MSIPNSVPSRITRAKAPSLTIHPTSSLYNSVGPDDEIPFFELPPALSDKDTFSSSFFQHTMQIEHENGIENEHENEEAGASVLIIPHREVLVPELFNFSFGAEPRQRSSSLPCSPLSRPVQPTTSTVPISTSTSNATTAYIPSTSIITNISKSTTSNRSPLDHTIHLTTYTLSSLNTIKDGIPNTQSTYFHSSSPSSLKILFPHSSSFLRSLDRLISTLISLLRRLKSHFTSISNSTYTRFLNVFVRNRNHSSRCPPASHITDLPLQQINTILTNLSTTIMEPTFEIFKTWHDCPTYGNDWYYKKKVILSMDCRFETFERRIKGVQRDIWELRGLGIRWELGMGSAWLCDLVGRVRGLVGR